MRPVDAVLPHQSGTSSGSTNVETAFNAAVSRHRSPLPLISTAAGPGQAVFAPPALPPLQVGAAETDQPRPPLLPLPIENDPFARPAHPAAEAIRIEVFERGHDIDQVAKKRGMDEQQVTTALDGAHGVTVNTDQNSIGTQVTISDARTGKTVNITHDHEKATRSTSVTKAGASRDGYWVDGNGATVRTTHDAKTGTRTTRIQDPRSGTVSETTVPRDGQVREVVTDARGKKTVKIVGEDYTTVTSPGGKVTATDHAKGTTVEIERLTYAEAVKRDCKLARDIEAAIRNVASVKRRADEAGVPPDDLPNFDPSQLNLHQAQLYKEYVEGRSNLAKLIQARHVLVAQYRLSLTGPRTSARHAGINNLLDAVHAQQRTNASADADVKVAEKVIPFIQANDSYSRYALFGPALEAYRTAPGHEEHFRSGGFDNSQGRGLGEALASGAGHTGKLLKQEVFYRDGHLYLRNTYENKVFWAKSGNTNVLECPLTADPDKPLQRTTHQREVDAAWWKERHTFGGEVDTGWEKARNWRTQAEADYNAARRQRADTAKGDVDAAIPRLRKDYEMAADRHGVGQTARPKGEDRIRIQVDGQARWVHPDVATAYLALRTAQAQSAGLEAQSQEAAGIVTFINSQRASEGPFLSHVASPEHDRALWNSNLLPTRLQVNAAQSRYADIQSDRAQSQAGIHQAKIDAWRRDHSRLAARLDALEKDLPQGGSHLPAAGPSGSLVGSPVNFVGPVVPAHLAPQTQAMSRTAAILRSEEARPLVEARAHLQKLGEEQRAIKQLQGDLGLERKWIEHLGRMPEDQRRNQVKRGESKIDFIRIHPQEYSGPAQALQRELGGPIVGRDRELVRSMVQTMAGDMQQAEMEIDVEYVVNQILRSEQINGDNPDQTGDLTIKPIAMQYVAMQYGQEAASPGSMRTGMFEITNRQGKHFLVDLKGHIWNSRKEFLDNNKLYSDEGILLMPKNLDTTALEYEARTARNLSWFEKQADPLLAKVTFFATIGSAIPYVNVVGAPIALAGGAYFGARSGIGQYQHVTHGGSWRDEETAMNSLSVAAAAAPMAGSAFRTAGLAARGVPWRSAATFSIGAAGPRAEYLARAEYLSRASLLRQQGFGSMQLARVSDGIAFAAGVPLLGASARNLADLDGLSGSEQGDVLMDAAGGLFGTVTGARGLVATRAGRSEAIRVEDAPPAAEGSSPRSTWNLFRRNGNEAPGSGGELTSGVTDPLIAQRGQWELPVLAGSQRRADGPSRNAPRDPSDPGPRHSSEAVDPIGNALAAMRGTRTLSEGELAQNREEAANLLKQLTRGLTWANGIDALRIPDVADQAGRSPILVELLRIAARNKVIIIDGASNPLQIHPRHHQMDDVEYSRATNRINLQSDQARQAADRAGTGTQGYVAELVGQLTHELTHAVQSRSLKDSDLPMDLHGADAFKATYVNAYLRLEGEARLIEFAVGDELQRNRGYFPPVYLDSDRSTEAGLFAQFKRGDLSREKAAAAIGRVVPDSYRQEFAEAAESAWEQMPPEERRKWEGPQSRSAAMPDDGAPSQSRRSESRSGPTDPNEADQRATSLGETDLVEQLQDPQRSTRRSANLIRAFDSLPNYGGWPPELRAEADPVIVKGTDIPIGISPHEFLLLPSLHKTWVERGQSIVLDLARPTGDDHTFARKIADISGNYVLASKIDDPDGWEVFSPRPPVRHQVKAIELGEGGAFYLIADGGRSQIRPEDHLGHLMGFGDNSTAFEIGDKVVLVSHRANPRNGLAGLLESRGRLEELGAPHLAKIHGRTTVYGRDAVLMDRYYVNSRDAVSYLSGYTVHDVSLLSHRSVESLQAVKSFLIEHRIDMTDLQFLIGSDGTFHLADFGQILSGRPPSGHTIETVDAWISRASGKGGTGHGPRR